MGGVQSHRNSRFLARYGYARNDKGVRGTEPSARLYVAKNATLRAARPDPSLGKRKCASLRMTRVRGLFPSKVFGLCKFLIHYLCV